MNLENPLRLGAPRGYPFDPEHVPNYGQPTTRNRAATVVYELSELATNRRPAGALSPAEKLALPAGLWIAEHILDEISAHLLPPEMRPGIVRLAQLAEMRFPGGVVFQDLNDLGEPAVQAAVVQLFASRSLPVAVAGRGDRNPASAVMTKSQIAYLTEKGGGYAKVAAIGQVLAQEAQHELVSWMEETNDMPFHVGTGSPRGWEQACDLAQCLRLDGASQRAVQNRLNLDGYLNERGARCWHVHNTRRAGGWQRH